MHLILKVSFIKRPIKLVSGSEEAITPFFFGTGSAAEPSPDWGHKNCENK